MNFKRPSFKRGGPTGIAQLTPRKNFQFGTPGFNYLESGLQNELRAQNELRNRPGIGTRTVSGGRQNIPTGGLTKGSRGARLLSQLRGLSVPSLSTTGIMAAPFVLPAGLAYMNKPETLAEKKVMQDYGPIDETFFDYDKYYADRKEASKVGDKISFSDALFMDPETGQYPKMFGRTEDRNKAAEIENLRAVETDLEDGITNYENDEAEAAEQKSALDSALDTMIKDKPEDKPKGGDKPKEPTFEDTYQTEFNRIQKLIGDDNTKGMAAIALSEAIGTPGTLADKAAVLNKSLLGLMGNKKKDKKEIAMLAYKATKEIEKAKIVAGKMGYSEKLAEKATQYNRTLADPNASESDKKYAASELAILNKTIRTLNPAKEGLGAGFKQGGDAVNALSELANDLANRTDKTSKQFKDDMKEYNARLTYLASQNDAGLDAALKNINDQLRADLAAVGLKDGGRIGLANGSPMEQITETETVTLGSGAVPTAATPQLSFDEIRNRLPKEISDEVVKLIAGSNQALQDFSYIRTQGDVDTFNRKYGVTLVLPAQA
jgi:hypothetical protein